jgi:hypothetical protein
LLLVSCVPCSLLCAFPLLLHRSFCGAKKRRAGRCARKQQA